MYIYIYIYTHIVYNLGSSINPTVAYGAGGAGLATGDVIVFFDCHVAPQAVVTSP